MSKRLTDGDETAEAGRANLNSDVNKKTRLESNGTHLLTSRDTEKSGKDCGPDQMCHGEAGGSGTEVPSKTTSQPAATSTSKAPGKQTSSPSQVKPSLLSNSVDDREYFASYARLDIHRTMIDDTARTQAYRRAILTNYKLFYGKTVLDVGCGTGILSVFCCQAGARRVYAVEASDAAKYARAVAEENGYADRVRVLQCRVEDVELPEKVDVIVSEWMGHALFYESMLESVLVARDRWLRPGGVMFPERAVLKIALCAAPDLALETGAEDFWRGVHDRYKVKMSCLAKAEQRHRWCDLPARVTALLPEEVHSHAETLFDLDLLPVLSENLRDMHVDGVKLHSFGRAELTGLALWFDVMFPGGDVLSTSPYVEETHWGQTVLPLKPVIVDQDTVVRCPLHMRPDPEHPRNWRFRVDLAIGGDEPRSVEWVMDGTG